MGVPFLDNVPAFRAMYPNAKLYVEWAPGAAPPEYGETEAGWPWDDITADVMQDGGRAIQISPMGRSDYSQRTPTAGCAFQLDNRSGNYSQGPQSSNYPNVRVNTPIRVCVSLTGFSSDKVVRFQGYTYSMRPSWDTTGEYAIVSVQAAGIMRRLDLKDTPLRSPMYRAFSTVTDTVVRGYWPMEDESGATSFASGVANRSPMRFANMSLASYSGLSGSYPLPTLSADSTYSADVRGPYSVGIQVDFHTYRQAVPASDTAVMRLHMAGSGTISRWELVMVGGDSISMKVTGYAPDGTLAVNSTINYGFTLYGRPLHWDFSIRQNGGNIQYQLGLRYSLGGSGATGSGSIAGTRGNLYRLDMLPNAQNDGTAIGQIIVYDDYDYTQEGAPAFGWDGDTAQDRITRLASEQNVPVALTTTPYEDRYTFLGVQPKASFLDLIRDAVDADLGVLYDGLGPGLGYRARAEIYNQTPLLTLDAALGDLVPEFQPEDDDRLTVNEATVSRRDGSSYTAEDTDGPLGKNTIGTYADSVTLGVQSDDQLETIAEWLVALGTVEGYRYPQVSLDLRRRPAKVAAWLSARPGDRVDVLNVGVAMRQHAGGTIRLIAEGWTERISRFVWDVTVNCSPADRWGVFQVALPAGDTSEFVGRLDASGSTVSASASQGATSFTVATATGHPLWTTRADDFPLSVDVGGWQVFVTGVSGTSSPQTFTCTALPVTLTAGTPMSVWRPPVLAL